MAVLGVLRRPVLTALNRVGGCEVRRVRGSMRGKDVYCFVGEDLRARPLGTPTQLKLGNLIPDQPVDVLKQSHFTGTQPPHL